MKKIKKTPNKHLALDKETIRDLRSRLRIAGATACVLVACAASCTSPEVGADVTFTERVHVMPLKDPATVSTTGAGSAAPAGAHLTYFGGKVVQNAQVTQVLYGSGTYIPELTSTSAPDMASAYTQMLTSGVFDWLSEYDTTSPDQEIGRGSFGGSVQIAPAASRNGSTITDASIQSEIAAQITAGTLPAPTDNQIYMVSFPAGKSLVQPDGSLSCVPNGFCAYHGTFKIGTQNVYYGVLPALTDSGCAHSCGGGTAFQNQQSVASHELIETITDAEIGLTTVVAPPLAWYDFDLPNKINGEIGDLCVAQQATFVGLDGNNYTIQQEFSNQDNACIAKQPPGPRIGVLSGGHFLVKEGGLTAAWVDEFAGVTKGLLSGDRIGVLSGGHLFVKEGDLTAAWVDEFAGVDNAVLAGNRIGVLSGGHFFVKEGDLHAGWVDELAGVTKGLLSADRIGVLSGGHLFVKEGDLTAAWVDELAGVDDAVLAGNRIGVLSGGHFLVKEGDLHAGWVDEFAGVTKGLLSGDRIGVLSGGHLFVNEGDLSAAWVDEFAGVDDAALSGNRIGVLSGGQFLIKEGDLNAVWAGESAGVTSGVLPNN